MRAIKTLEHKFKAALFFLLRAFLKKGRSGYDKIDGKAITRVLFLRPEKIGDMVISFPVFDALKAKYPHIRIGLLGSPRNYGIIRQDPRFDRIFLFRKKPLRDLRELLAMRREKYDCVLDMINDDSMTTLLFSQFAAKTSPRVGIGKLKYETFYDYNFVHADGVGGHIIDNTLKLLRPFGIDGDTVNRYASPYVPDDVMAGVNEFIRAIDPEASGLRVGFNLSAGKPNRIWAPEKAEQLARRLLAVSENLRLILIATPDDRARGEALLARLDGAAVLVPPGQNLLQVSGLISRLQLLISPDTSLIHIARSFRVPVVGLYSRGSKNFRRWRPFDQADGAVVAEAEDDLFDITADQVYRQVVSVLEREKLVSS